MSKTPLYTSDDLVKLWPFGVAEYGFRPERGWRFDWAIPEFKLAVELDDRGHRHFVRWLDDIEKFNEAELQGWRVFRVTHQMVGNGEAEALMKRILETFVEVKTVRYRDESS